MELGRAGPPVHAVGQVDWAGHGQVHHTTGTTKSQLQPTVAQQPCETWSPALASCSPMATAVEQPQVNHSGDSASGGAARAEQPGDTWASESGKIIKY